MNHHLNKKWEKRGGLMGGGVKRESDGRESHYHFEEEEEEREWVGGWVLGGSNLPSARKSPCFSC